MSGDGGWTTLTKASDKPRNLSKNLQKKIQVASSDMFSVQVIVLRLKSASCNTSHRFWAEKCDLQLRVFRQQISEKFVVSTVANVCHLHNRARNTRKLKILMF